MKESLQKIEDYYVNHGYSKKRLERKLKQDKLYQRILTKRKSKLKLTTYASEKEKRKYVLSTDKDFVILLSCRRLEGKRLTTHDRKIVLLIKSQLKTDWRSELILALNKISRKYK